MIFLIQYSRSDRKIVRFEPFPDSARDEAQRLRLEIELHAASSGSDHEVVLLEAASESDVRQTHGRYFEDLESLTRRPLS